MKRERERESGGTRQREREEREGRGVRMLCFKRGERERDRPLRDPEKGTEGERARDHHVGKPTYSTLLNSTE